MIMAFLKNAIRNIARSKGRSILIGIIEVVIAVSSCISLAIKNAADTARKQGINQLAVTAQITTNRNKIISDAGGNQSKMRELLQKYDELPADDLKKYAKSKYVKDFIYELDVSMKGGGTLKPFSTSNNSGSDNGPSLSVNGPGEMGDFTVKGYSSENALTDFLNGTSKITEGKLFNMDSDALTCIVNSDLAAYDKLKVGDKIKLSNPNNKDEEYEFTIVGIYTNTSTSSSDMMLPNMLEPANQIYTSYTALKSVVDNSAAVAKPMTDKNTGEQLTTELENHTTATYVFANVQAYENFKTDVVSMGLSEYYSVDSEDIDNYTERLLPLDNLSKFATTMLIIVLLIGGIILVVLNIFNIRERKYEVGVLTAIGMKKGKVALQFITELFMITLVAVIIGAAAGAAASIPAANGMLEEQIVAQQNKANQQNQNLGQGPTTVIGGGATNGPIINGGNASDEKVNYISRINAVVDLSILGQLIAIGFLLTLFSSAAGVIFVMRYEPLKILSERS